MSTATHQTVDVSMGVGSGRQGTANAVTWILALDKVDMGMLRFLSHSLQNTLDVNLILCFAVCERAINQSRLQISALTERVRTARCLTAITFDPMTHRP